MNTGTYRAGDGDAATFAGNVGLPLGSTGFANLSLEYANSDPTNRSVQRDDAAALIAAGNTHVADPAQIWGNPTIEDELKFFGNFGNLFANGVQLYGHTNYAEKKVTEGFYFRNPNSRQNIYSLDGGETLLIGDVVEARGMGLGQLSHRDGDRHRQPADVDWHTVGPGGPGPHLRRRQLLLVPGTPAGRRRFTPRFGGVVSDMSVVGGIRRLADNGLTWDASVVSRING